MAEKKTKVDDRIIDKGITHNILMARIKKLYRNNSIGIGELSRLTGIEYFKLRRLLFDGTRDWSADEFFKMVIICNVDGAISAIYKAHEKDLARLHRREGYDGSAKKKPGPKPDPNSQRQQMLKAKWQRKAKRNQKKYYAEKRKEKLKMEKAGNT